MENHSRETKLSWELLMDPSSRLSISYYAMSKRVVKILPFLEICMRRSHNSCEINSKRCGKNVSSSTQFFILAKLTSSFQVSKKMKRIFFWKFSKKWNYYTYFDPKWPLAVFFHHHLIFQGFQKSHLLQFFAILWKTREAFFFKNTPLKSK